MKSNSNIQAAALNPSFLLFVALPGMHARAADRLAAEKKKRTVAAEEKRSREEEEGEGDESDDDSNDAWGLLEKACKYFESQSFQEEIDIFTRYSELHAQYLDLFESLLCDFLEGEGRSAEELFSDMKDAKENNYTPLFEEHEFHGFVNSLLAAMDYRDFYRLMLAASRKSTCSLYSSRTDSCGSNTAGPIRSSVDDIGGNDDGNSSSAGGAITRERLG